MSKSIWDGLYGDVEVRRVQPYEALKDVHLPWLQSRHLRGYGALCLRANRSTRLASPLALRLLGSPLIIF